VKKLEDVLNGKVVDMAWKTTEDLLNSIKDATDRLVGGETPVDEAHAEARLLGVASKVIALRLDHARLTGRLEQGLDRLPDIKLD
jgi:hypothetical protein